MKEKQELKLVEIFCEAEDFCKQNIKEKIHPGRKCGLSTSEIITILTFANYLQFKDLKSLFRSTYYQALKEFFFNMPQYSGFIKARAKITRELNAFAKSSTKSKTTNIYIIDSTPLPVCKKCRVNSHKTFRGLANFAYSSTDSCFGLKLHLIINEHQKVIDFQLKQGNVHDINCVEELSKSIQGYLLGDRGYCSEPKRLTLAKKGIKLLYKTRKNMKNPNYSQYELQLLKRRSLVETVIGKIKYFFGYSLAKFRSVSGAFANLYAAILAVNFDS